MLAQVIAASSKALAFTHGGPNKLNAEDHKEEACCEAFVRKQCNNPHYTNLFSLVRSQDVLTGL